jgi:hypothetical protein
MITSQETAFFTVTAAENLDFIFALCMDLVLISVSRERECRAEH